MDTTNDDGLRDVQRRKQAALGMEVFDDAETCALEPIIVPCGACGKPITTAPLPSFYHLKLPRLKCSECVEADRLHQEEDRQRRQQEAIDAGKRAQEAALEAVRADMPGALAQCGVPVRWQGASLERSPDLPQALVEAGSRWAKDPQGMLYLYGQPGAGKTHLAVAILSSILQAGTFTPSDCRYLSERGFLDDIKAGFDRDGAPVSAGALPPDHPRRLGLLLYDDIGASRLTDWARGEVAALIEHRHAEGLPTIITSNLAPDDLAQAVDGRVLSRIAESRQLWQFPKRDLRITGTVHPARAQKN